MKYNRGGKTLRVGDIGRFSVLRQNMLLPGERMNTSIRGNVRLSGLRQQTSVYLHAQIEAFAAPLRWYWDDWTDYVQEGVGTAKTIPVLTGAQWTADRLNTQEMGIGHITHDFAKWYAQHPINVWNEWYRWPEDAKESVDTPVATFFDAFGKPCINLASGATRLHDAPVFDASESTVPSAAADLDVRELSQVQARFQQASVSDWTSQERYMAFMKDIFRAKGSNEVDKVPIRLKKGAELSVMPRDMYATDGPSLGELMSINNFQVNHSWGGFIAPEHMIVCYVMLLRFAPILQDGVKPGIYPSETQYVYYQGDPEIIGNRKPVQVSRREIDNADATVIGYLPAGWQWREGYNHIDARIASTDEFPLLDDQPLTAAGYRDATKVNLASFRSTQLRHWFCDMDFTVNVDSPIFPAGQSITAGGSGRGPKGNHPTGGWLI